MRTDEMGNVKYWRVHFADWAKTCWVKGVNEIDAIENAEDESHFSPFPSSHAFVNEITEDEYRNLTGDGLVEEKES
jgi:hypothetical protein